MSYFYSKNGHNSGENDCNGKKYKLVLKTIEYKKVFLKYQPIQGILHYVRPPAMALELYFYSKNGHNMHNSNENDRTGKIFTGTIVLKTTHKKVFLKYEVNPRLLPCVCMAIYDIWRVRSITFDLE